MPRRLSDYEYFQFFLDVNLAELPIPPWGIVLKWADMDILVFEAFDGETHLTDITDIREDIEIAPPWEYRPDAAYAIWHLPAETANRIQEVIREVLEPSNYMVIALLMFGGFLLVEGLK